MCVISLYRKGAGGFVYNVIVSGKDGQNRKGKNINRCAFIKCK